MGYAVVGKSGNIWEFAYAPNYDGKKIVIMILKWSLEYARMKGANSVTVNAPVKDQIIREVCKELEFAEASLRSMNLAVLDYPELIKVIISSRKEILTHCDETFLIRLRDASHWIEDCVTIEIKRGKVSVLEGKVDKPGVIIDTDVLTFTSCIFGITGIFKAILRLRVRVRPFRKLRGVLNLFSMLRIKDPWYIPRGDTG